MIRNNFRFDYNPYGSTGNYNPKPTGGDFFEKLWNSKMGQVAKKGIDQEAKIRAEKEAAESKRIEKSIAGKFDKMLKDQAKQTEARAKEIQKATEAANKAAEGKKEEKKTEDANKTPDIEFTKEDKYDKDFEKKEAERRKKAKPICLLKDAASIQLEQALTEFRGGTDKVGVNVKKIRATLESYAIKSAIYGIGGMPATYLDNTDPPLPNHEKDDGLGYQYINTVIRYGTFIAFQPGVITWSLKLDGIDLQTLTNPQNVSYLQKKVIAGGIDFNQPKLKEYYMEVDRHCRIAILLMGIEELGIAAAHFGTHRSKMQYGGGLGISKPTVKGFSFNTFTHQDIANLGLGLADSVIQGIPMASFSAGAKEDETQSSGFVVFYVDGGIQASDTISNSAEPSEFKQSLDALVGDTSSAVKEVMGKTLGAFDGTNALLTFLGGNAIIPDVWKDTTYQKSYTFTIKLISASGDPVSVFMNVMYPLIKLLCLATPMGTGGFYSSAPILRVFSQGVINTEYGLIESMTINRKMETLNDYGMPTEVDVEITLRDLNSYIYRQMPGWWESGMTLSSSMTTFLATLCGINVTTLTRTQKMTLNEKLYEAYISSTGTTKNYFDRKYQGWSDMAENGMYSMQETAQSVRLGFSRTWGYLTTAPGEIIDRVVSAPKTIGDGVSNTVANVGKSLTGKK